MNRALIAAAAVGFTAVAAPTQAALIDLTTPGASGSVGGVSFNQGVGRVAGTGYVDSFLRIQSKPNERGYNTSGGTPLDTKAGLFTHDLLLGSLGLVTAGPDALAKLFLDINQDNDRPASLLSLDKFQIYLTTTPSQTTTAFTPGGDLDLVNATKIYDLGDNLVLLEGSLASGSGQKDMSIDIPSNLFAGYDPAATYLVAYAAFGDRAASNGGFEEFWYDTGAGFTISNPPPVPEPASLGLLGLGAVALLGQRRLRKNP